MFPLKIKLFLLKKHVECIFLTLFALYLCCVERFRDFWSENEVYMGITLNICTRIQYKTIVIFS